MEAVSSQRSGNLQRANWRHDVDKLWQTISVSKILDLTRTVVLICYEETKLG